MTLRPLNPEHLQQDMIPQAVLAVSETDLSRRVRLVRGRDDFDTFLGGAFKLDDETEFAVKHYAGHPAGTFTIYLRPELRDVDTILTTLQQIVTSLDMSLDAMIWDRSKDPEL